LGVEEGNNINHKNEKEKLKKEYVRRLRLILKMELSVKNKMQATGAHTIPVLRYIFKMINWHQEEIKKIGQKNKENANHGQHHPRANIDHSYAPRKEGGREMM